MADSQNVKHDHNDHIVRTKEQWDDRAIANYAIPRGVLCIELTSKTETRLKIGEGDKFYKQLPYVGGDSGDLSNYYTKQEVDNIIANLNFMSIASTRIYDSKSQLPLNGNKLGDLRFVRGEKPTDDPFEYLWNGNKWIQIGGYADIDLSKYVTREEIMPRIQSLEKSSHTHSNKSILDQITASYTIEEKQKLAELKNYDDTQIKRDISELQSKAHTHINKSILDQTTAPFTREEKTKLAELENYDDTEITSRVSDLEDVAHTHTNKSVLDLVEEPYTTAEKTKLASLENYTLPTASSDTLGGVKVGDGLTIDVDGVLSATGGSSGGGDYSAGDAIEFRDSVVNVPITNIRFFATGKRANDRYFQMSELEFYDTSDHLITFSDVTAYIGESSSIPGYPVASENVTKLFDGDTTTKMCCYWSDEGIRVDMTLTSSIMSDLLKSYRYCTGNDFPARDPVSWNVLASSDNGATWFTIDTRSNETVPSTRNTYTNSFSTSVNKQTINVKYGDGLTLDQNGALTVIDTGQEYVAGDGISIDEGSSVTDITSLTWEQGSINPNNGEPDDFTTTTIRSPMIDVGLTSMLNVSAQATDNSDMLWKAAFYDSNSEFISMTTTWQTLSDGVTRPANAAHVIIVLRKDAETDIDENALLSCEISWPIEIGKCVITNTGVTHAELESSSVIVTENGETKTLLTFGQDLDVTNGVVSIPDYHRLVLNVEE